MQAPDYISFIIKGSKAYFTVSAKIKGGGSFDIGPTYEVPLEVQAIKNMSEQVRNLSSGEISPPTEEEMKTIYKKDTLLEATKTKSWNQLAKVSASYGIIWYPDKIELYLHQLDKKGRFASGTQGRKKIYSKDTKIEEILSDIFKDAEQFPHVLQHE